MIEGPSAHIARLDQVEPISSPAPTRCRRSPFSHPRRFLLRSIGICLASPSHSLRVGRGVFLTVICGQIFAYSAFSGGHFLEPQLSIGDMLVHGTFRHANTAVLIHIHPG